MIEHGAIPFIKVPSHIIDSTIIAEMELNEKKIPFIIKRPLPNNGFENAFFLSIFISVFCKNF
jgi:DNA-directed RNA polymerase subunit K/omega